MEAVDTSSSLMIWWNIFWGDNLVIVESFERLTYCSCHQTGKTLPINFLYTFQKSRAKSVHNFSSTFWQILHITVSFILSLWILRPWENLYYCHLKRKFSGQEIPFLFTFTWSDTFIHFRICQRWLHGQENTDEKEPVLGNPENGRAKEERSSACQQRQH